MRPTSRLISLAACSALMSFLVSCAPVAYSGRPARTYLGFTVGIAEAPVPPVIAFQGDPHLEFVEASDVRVVEAPDPDCDLFQYRGGYFLYRNGFWYRSGRVDGPYQPIEVHHVPRPVLNVPDGYWRHRPYRDAGDRDDHDRDRDHEHR
ncbi:MAG: hypothetical protein ACHQ52_05975 [Candidatus Eisenbacteria bacterium]